MKEIKSCRREFLLFWNYLKYGEDWCNDHIIWSNSLRVFLIIIPPLNEVQGVYRNHLWVYHHEKMCRVHSWSIYNLELWPQGQIYRIFDMFSWPSYNLFLFWHWLTIFGTWCIPIRQCVAYIHDSDTTLTFDLNIKIIFESCKMSSLFDIGIPNFGIWVYHHETICCVHSWP